MMPAPMFAPQVNDPLFPPLENYWLMCANEIADVLKNGDGDCRPYLRAINAPAVRAIQDACCKYYGVTRNDLISQRRAARTVRARHVCMYLCRTETARSFPEIGRMFSGKDHTTVMLAVRKVTDRLQEFDEEISAIRARLK